ncbi:Cytosine deaminase [Leclercia adecarboxylata]|uniref:Cytosine deaminase n=1 Tax=Leclercia adecarboxylata TaxID=83655 RepID=A0A4U9IDH1_9ENTR|nr:Cytosine deaminase [Leclercia adecarboxylata]
MTEDKSRREFLSQSGKIATAATACALFGATGSVAYAADTAKPICETGKPMNITATHYYLDNVLLEAGFNFDGNVAVSTRTELKTLEIKDGKIAALLDNNSHADATLPHYDAGGKLLLPAMRDMHIHLDKTFYGGPWRSLNRPAGTTIQDMIRLEQKLLPELQPYTQERAEKLIDLIQSKGSTIARSHCNIEPVSGLKNLENLQAVLARRKPGFDCEIVAFPQHGLLLSNAEKLMREAMQAGAHYVGGLDPTSVDGAMEKSLNPHVPDCAGLRQRGGYPPARNQPGGRGGGELHGADRRENPELKGKLTISHAFALATMNEQQVDEIATRMAAQQVTIASTVPIGTLHMPLKQLRDKGVFVHDRHRQRDRPLVRRMASATCWKKPTSMPSSIFAPNEQTLSRALGIATGDVLPLNDNGERVWPKAQDAASFVLVDASCSAEAVARISPRTATFHNGNLVWGTVS